MRQNMFPGERGKVFQDLFVGHAGSQPLQNIRNGDPGPLDTGLSEPYIRMDGDVFLKAAHRRKRLVNLRTTEIAK